MSVEFFLFLGLIGHLGLVGLAVYGLRKSRARVVSEYRHYEPFTGTDPL